MSLGTLRVAVLGAGNMGAALIAGLVRSGRLSPEHLTAADPRESAREPLARLGVRTVGAAAAAVPGQDLVVLAVKPQVAEPLLREIGGLIEPGQLLVSIMAGVSTASIEAWVGRPVPVVRAMPQTLVRLGAGATALCVGQRADGESLSLAQAFFEAVGVTAIVPESLMDAVTGLSGSGPAYLYTVIEAL
ncbi:MAG: NAD(P)-binding domain-containing protein, partial [Candidatus Latescibacterota bacterium]